MTVHRSNGISIIILDDVDQLVKHLYFGEGRATVSHDLMHAVSTLITATPPTGLFIYVMAVKEFHMDTVVKTLATHVT